MKKFLSLIIFLLFISVNGQMLKKSSLSSNGGSATTGNLYMVYAIGEIGTNEADQGNLHLSEGFVGPDFTALLGIENYSRLEGVKIFPNPADKFMQVSFPETADYEIQIYDLGGKIIWSKSIQNESSITINTSQFRPGTYVIGIINRENKQFAALKFVKR